MFLQNSFKVFNQRFPDAYLENGEICPIGVWNRYRIDKMMNRSLTNILPSAGGGASPSAGVAPSAGFSPSAAAAAFSSSAFAASLASPATALASASYFECYYKNVGTETAEHTITKLTKEVQNYRRVLRVPV